MGYKRKPNYHFDNQLSTGINKIPDNRVVVVSDFNGKLKTFTKKNNSTLNDGSTIQEAYDNNNIIFINDIDDLEESLSLKSNVGHTHVTRDIDGLDDILEQKADIEYVDSIISGPTIAQVLLYN